MHALVYYTHLVQNTTWRHQQQRTRRLVQHVAAALSFDQASLLQLLQHKLDVLMGVSVAQQQVQQGHEWQHQQQEELQHPWQADRRLHQLQHQQPQPHHPQ